MTPSLPPIVRRPPLMAPKPACPLSVVAEVLFTKNPEFLYMLSLRDVVRLCQTNRELYERTVRSEIREKLFCLRFPGTVPVPALSRNNYEDYLESWLDGFSANRENRPERSPGFSHNVLFFSIVSTLQRTPALTLAHRASLQIPGKCVKDVSFTPDGNALVIRTSCNAYEDKTALLSLDAHGSWSCDKPLVKRHEGPDRISWSADSQHLAVISNEMLITIMTKVGSACWLPTARIFCTGEQPYHDDEAREHHEERYHQLDARYLAFSRLPEPLGRVRRVLFSPDRKNLAITDTAHNLQVWSKQGLYEWRRALAVPAGPHDNKIGFSPNGCWLAVHSGARTARLYKQYATGSWMEHTRIEYERFIFQVLFSPDSRELLLALSDGTAALWRLDEAGCFETERLCHGRGIIAGQFSPDGQTLAARCLGRQVALWTRTATSRWQGPVVLDNKCTADTFCFTPDGQRLFLADRSPGVAGYLTSWLMRSHGVWELECHLTFEASTGIDCFQPNPDGYHLWAVHRTARGDRALVLWGHDCATAQWRIKAGRQFSADDSPQALSVSPDSCHLALNMGDGVLVFQLREAGQSSALLPEDRAERTARDSVRIQ